MLLTPHQCKAARALLDWSQADLAGKSRVSSSTLANFEAGKRIPYERTLQDIISILTKAGITFIKTETTEGVVRDLTVNVDLPWGYK